MLVQKRDEFIEKMCHLGIGLIDTRLARAFFLVHTMLRNEPVKAIPTRTAVDLRLEVMVKA